MPTVQKTSSVLLTGASGFLAAHILQQLIDRGFKVRGTVRSKEKGEYLTKEVVKGSKNFEYVIVEDVETEGAFNEAVKGVDAVLHTASPFHFNVQDPWKDLIDPAVKGTKNLLQAAATEKGIKRVVITSSFAAIVNPYDPVYVFKEDEDWNEYSPKQVEEKGKDVDPAQAYRASKTLAERAAWDFIEKEKPGFDLATINPPLIFGPIIHDVPSPDKLNTSVNNFYQFLKGKKDADAATAGFGSLVDVRDVAQLHIDALVTEGASNQRFSVSNMDSSYQPLLDVFFSKASSSLHEVFPNAQKGHPGTPKPKQNQIDNSKAKKTFGWEPISMEKTVLDMAESLAEYEKKWQK
ncbi:SDR family oxidoreductase [Sporobolomyces salmoneus]|uniref:SDR family oxidoreductase n=1 Tax=Sporobolomyces salmoneus TaxID=183962 RepID=UPI0031773085